MHFRAYGSLLLTVLGQFSASGQNCFHLVFTRGNQIWSVNKLDGGASYSNVLSPATVNSVAWGQHESVFYGVTGQQKLVAIDPSTQEATNIGPIGTNEVTGLAVADGVLYGHSNAEHGFLLEISTQSGQGQTKVETGNTNIKDLAYNPSDRFLYFASGAGRIRRTDLSDFKIKVVGNIVGLSPSQRVRGITFDPQGVMYTLVRDSSGAVLLFKMENDNFTLGEQIEIASDLPTGPAVGLTMQCWNICRDDGVIFNDVALDVLATSALPEIGVGLLLYNSYGYTIGSTTELIAEANDASATGATVKDGVSGDTNFAFGDLKPIATMGERSVCDGANGQKLVGPPDGIGAYLVDDSHVRVLFQAESYGPLSVETYPYQVNSHVMFTGSHLQYIDYVRADMLYFMDGDWPASNMVADSGNMIKYAYNLKGEQIARRKRDGPTEYGAHFGNTDADGNYAARSGPVEADWFFQSFCSAHMELPYQWGNGIGLADKVFMTNEEWMTWKDNVMFVGISAQAIDVVTKTAHAVGAFGQGGYEKIVEINSQHKDYVVWVPNGYNGNFNGNLSAVLNARNDRYSRTDGKPYVLTNNVMPARIYVGVKNKMEDGSYGDDFLARNGLRYGQLYGYAIDMSQNGPSNGMWRDRFHRDPMKAYNGARVDGMWVAQKWRWDGVVRNFQHDGAWDYQNKPPGTDDYPDLYYWNYNGLNTRGCKSEHVAPDTTEATTGFIQGSTCGYFGHYYVHDVNQVLSNAKGKLPAMFEGSYFVYQGELDVTEQIQLGGSGKYPGGLNAKINYGDPSQPNKGKATFEDIDGMEVIDSKEGRYLVIQEDSRNIYGERQFITKLEHKDDGNELTYYLIAQSGGRKNTRALGKVGIPRFSVASANSHEFSGIVDLSAYLNKNENASWSMSAKDDGTVKHDIEKAVSINEKHLLLCLQAHNHKAGLLNWFRLDRGGQIYMYKPNLP